MDQAVELPHLEDAAATSDYVVELLDLTKQQRNLLLLRPLLHLELSKNSIGSAAADTAPLFKDVDTHYLMLTALDQMMEGTTIHMGSTPAELIDRLMGVAQTMKPALTTAQAHRIAEVILDTLDNKANSYREFAYDFFDGPTRQVKTFRFRLVCYEPDLEDVYRYRPTAEGYLVYLGMLDLAPEDAQEFMGKMLDLLVQRGRFDTALEIAKRARTLSLEYRQFIRDRLMQARRAPGSLNWTKEVTGRLKDARAHVEARQAEDHRMTEAVREALLSAEEPKTRQDLAQLYKTLQSASAIRANLVGDITVAPDRFLQAQSALFRARRPSGLPDLESRLLPSLLKLGRKEIAESADDVFSGMYPGKWPKVYGLNSLFGLLLERRTDMAEPEEDSEGDIEPFVPLPEQFPQELVSRVQDWMARKFAITSVTGGCSTNELLAMADEEGLDKSMQRCLVFMMFRCFSQSETLFPAMRAEANGRFVRDVAQGTNLYFSPLEDPCHDSPLHYSTQRCATCL